MVADRAESAGLAGKEEEAFRTLMSSVPPLVLPPLLAPSAGAFAAATAMGLGFANQMAGAYLGFLKGAVETSRLMAEVMGAPEAEAPLAPETNPKPETVPETSSATVVSLKPKAKSVAEAKPRKAAAKPASDKKAPGRKAKPSTKADVDAPRDAGLRRLPGMGPKLEALLKARGLESLEAIAALSSHEALALDRELGLDGRIARDGWVEKAAALVKE